MKLIENQRYTINYINFLGTEVRDTVEYEGILNKDANELICVFCGKKSHKKLLQFHSLEAIHQWYYFGTICVSKINIKELT